jgi:RNA polymerase sigma factor (TIGR02999 family)
VEQDITQLLHAWHRGDRDALGIAMPRIYDALRRSAAQRMRGEREQTLSPTALVHEALLRMLGNDTDFVSRAHFLGIAALHMRSILIDHARARQAAKRGGGALHVTLGASGAGSAIAAGSVLELLALDQALTRLADHDARAARVMEMSCFAGMEQEEIAAAIGISVPTIARDMRFARAWLNRELSA